MGLNTPPRIKPQILDVAVPRVWGIECDVLFNRAVKRRVVNKFWHQLVRLRSEILLCRSQ